MNILTSFPFTFKLTVPGLSNPFTSLATNPPSPTNSKGFPGPTRSIRREPSDESRARAFIRPTRPLPISVAPLTPRKTRPTLPAFSPLPNGAPSSSFSREHGHSYLAPRAPFPASHSPSPAPVSRKRGWEPSNSPSPSEATLASTNGYLEVPAKYRDLAGQHGVEVQYVDRDRDLDDDDMPPAKRRRGIAGSIVSTAWSAALLGTAVGMTVYKLWRDRGKAEDEPDYSNDDSKMHGIIVEDMDAILDEPSSPPPPYNHEWRSTNYSQQDSYLQPSISYQQQILQQQHLLTPKSKGKQRAAVTPKSQRKTAGHSTKRVPAKSTGRVGAATRARPPIPSQFDFEHPPAAPSPAKRARSTYEPAHVPPSSSHFSNPPSVDVGMEDNNAEDEDDEMDWIGGKLAQLIEEGKKALGKEVVVMSEAKEDEEDDGSGAWVSDDEFGPPGALRGGKSRTGSVRSRAGRSSTVSVGVSGGSVNASNVGLSLPTTPSRARGMSCSGAASVGASPSSASVLQETEHFESPEVREMMEKARAKIAARLGRA